MTILVLGGSGYIGSALVPHLKMDGHTVITIDTLVYGGPVPSFNIDFDEIDVSSLDLIIHLAQYASPRVSDDPIQVFCDNTFKMTRLVARMHEDQKLLYISSSSVYAESEAPSIEDAPLSQRNQYEIFKIQCERILGATNANHMTLRLGTVCGIAPNFRIDTSINQMVYDAENSEVIKLDERAASSYRAILDMGDLKSAVSAVIESWQPRQTFNVASFNARLSDVARSVVDSYIAKPKLVSFDSGNLRSPSFMINSSKFAKEFGFKFMGTIESIIKDVKDGLRSGIAETIGRRDKLGS